MIWQGIARVLIFERLICSYLNLNMREPCLSVHVGFVFCMHVAVKKCACVIVGKIVQVCVVELEQVYEIASDPGSHVWVVLKRLTN